MDDPSNHISEPLQLAKKPPPTRWDRITRQHQHSQSDAQTADIRRLCGLNYVNGRQQLSMSNGGAGCVDPTLVMDMRHAEVGNLVGFL